MSGHHSTHAIVLFHVCVIFTANGFLRKPDTPTSYQQYPSPPNPIKLQKHLETIQTDHSVTVDINFHWFLH